MILKGKTYVYSGERKFKILRMKKWKNTIKKNKKQRKNKSLTKGSKHKKTKQRKLH